MISNDYDLFNTLYLQGREYLDPSIVRGFIQTQNIAMLVESVAYVLDFCAKYGQTTASIATYTDPTLIGNRFQILSIIDTLGINFGRTETSSEYTLPLISLVFTYNVESIFFLSILRSRITWQHGHQFRQAFFTHPFHRYLSILNHDFSHASQSSITRLKLAKILELTFIKYTVNDDFDEKGNSKKLNITDLSQHLLHFATYITTIPHIASIYNVLPISHTKIGSSTVAVTSSKVKTEFSDEMDESVPEPIISPQMLLVPLPSIVQTLYNDEKFPCLPHVSVSSNEFSSWMVFSALAGYGITMEKFVEQIPTMLNRYLSIIVQAQNFESLKLLLSIDCFMHLNDTAVKQDVATTKKYREVQLDPFDINDMMIVPHNSSQTNNDLLYTTLTNPLTHDIRSYIPQSTFMSNLLMEGIVVQIFQKYHCQLKLTQLIQEYHTIMITHPSFDQNSPELQHIIRQICYFWHLAQLVIRFHEGIWSLFRYDIATPTQMVALCIAATIFKDELILSRLETYYKLTMITYKSNGYDNQQHIDAISFGYTSSMTNGFKQMYKRAIAEPKFKEQRKTLNADIFSLFSTHNLLPCIDYWLQYKKKKFIYDISLPFSPLALACGSYDISIKTIRGLLDRGCPFLPHSKFGSQYNCVLTLLQTREQCEDITLQLLSFFQTHCQANTKESLTISIDEFYSHLVQTSHLPLQIDIYNRQITAFSQKPLPHLSNHSGSSSNHYQSLSSLTNIQYTKHRQQGIRRHVLQWVYDNCLDQNSWTKNVLSSPEVIIQALTPLLQINEPTPLPYEMNGPEYNFFIQDMLTLIGFFITPKNGHEIVQYKTFPQIIAAVIRFRSTKLLQFFIDFGYVVQPTAFFLFTMAPAAFVDYNDCNVYIPTYRELIQEGYVNHHGNAIPYRATQSTVAVATTTTETETETQVTETAEAATETTTGQQLQVSHSSDNYLERNTRLYNPDELLVLAHEAAIEAKSVDPSFSSDYRIPDRLPAQCPKYTSLLRVELATKQGLSQLLAAGLQMDISKEDILGRCGIPRLQFEVLEGLCVENVQEEYKNIQSRQEMEAILQFMSHEELGYCDYTVINYLYAYYYIPSLPQSSISPELEQHVNHHLLPSGITVQQLRQDRYADDNDDDTNDLNNGNSHCSSFIQFFFFLWEHTIERFKTLYMITTPVDGVGQVAVCHQWLLYKTCLESFPYSRIPFSLLGKLYHMAGSPQRPGGCMYTQWNTLLITEDILRGGITSGNLYTIKERIDLDIDKGQYKYLLQYHGDLPQLVREIEDGGEESSDENDNNSPHQLESFGLTPRQHPISSQTGQPTHMFKGKAWVPVETRRIRKKRQRALASHRDDDDEPPPPEPMHFIPDNVEIVLQCSPNNLLPIAPSGILKQPIQTNDRYIDCLDHTPDHFLFAQNTSLDPLFPQRTPRHVSTHGDGDDDANANAKAVTTHKPTQPLYVSHFSQRMLTALACDLLYQYKLDPDINQDSLPHRDIRRWGNNETNRDEFITSFAIFRRIFAYSRSIPHQWLFFWLHLVPTGDSYLYLEALELATWAAQLGRDGLFAQQAMFVTQPVQFHVFPQTLTFKAGVRNILATLYEFNGDYALARVADNVKRMGLIPEGQNNSNSEQESQNNKSQPPLKNEPEPSRTLQNQANYYTYYFPQVTALPNGTNGRDSAQFLQQIEQKIIQQQQSKNVSAGLTQHCLKFNEFVGCQMHIDMDGSLLVHGGDVRIDGYSAVLPTFDNIQQLLCGWIALCETRRHEVFSPSPPPGFRSLVVKTPPKPPSPPPVDETIERSGQTTQTKASSTANTTSQSSTPPSQQQQPQPVSKDPQSNAPQQHASDSPAAQHSATLPQNASDNDNTITSTTTESSPSSTNTSIYIFAGVAAALLGGLAWMTTSSSSASTHHRSSERRQRRH